MREIVIIGGGASGLFAGYSASLNKENHVTIIEKNEKLGKKIYITGKGRCNFTNNVLSSDFLNNVVTNPKFLYSAIYTFTPENAIDFFENNGMEVAIERGNRAFPKSNKASDVTKTVEKVLLKNKVDVILNTKVEKIDAENNVIKGVKTDKGYFNADSVIVCTGGISYPLTGSTGDGYNFAKHFGHSVIKPKSALCGIELKGNDYLPLQGLSLKNVSIKAELSGKEIYSDFGEMLFTHFGVSGPIILSCSSIINKYQIDKIKLTVDLKPALDEETLDNRLQREIAINNTKDVHNVLRSLLPSSMIDLIIDRAKIPANKKCSTVTKEERKRLVFTLKNLSFDIDGLRSIDEAIVTSGGVNVKEINAKTMESKIVKGLFFAGEVIDVDAFTGGFNLQIAFSTGYLAGQNA